MSDILEKDIDITEIKEKKQSELNKRIQKQRENKENKLAARDNGQRFNQSLDQVLNQTPSQYDEYKIKPESSAKIDYSIESSVNKSSLGPGIILKNMREEAKLSKDDVAKELRLSARHIEYLENDQYDKFSALVFYLGNVRNYSKLLSLDADKMIAKFHAVYKVKSENSNFTVVPVEGWQEVWPMKLFFSQEKSESEKTKNITILISSFVVACVFLLLWWVISSAVLKSSKTDKLIESGKQESLQLKPEQVDNLLPSAPVIVHNKKENLVSAAGVQKKSRIEALS